MSIIDKLASFDTGATVTGGTTTASVSSIDHGKTGLNLGSGRPLWAVFHIKGNTGGDGSDTFSFGVQTSDSTTFASGNVTIAASPTITGATNVPARVIVPIPAGVAFKRYTQATYAVTATAVLTVDSFLTDQEPYDTASYPN
jgi:hypothetical protein